MKKIWIFILTLFFINIIIFSSTFADDYTRWELPEGAKLRLGKGQIRNVARKPSFQFSPDSSQFMVFSSIGIWVYDAQTGEALRLLTGNKEGSPDDIIISPDWSTFASPIDNWNNPGIQLWDFHTGQLQTTFEGHVRGVTSIAFSPNGEMLVSGDFEGVMRLWDIGSGQHKRIPTPHNIVSDVVFSPDGRTIMSWRSGDYRLWDVKTGKIKAKLEGTDGIRKIDFSPDGQLLVGANDWEIRLWNADTGKIKMRFKVKKPRWRTILAFTPDGKTLASVGVNNDKVRLWDLHAGQLNKTLTGKPKHVKKIQVEENSVIFFELSGRRVDSMAFSPDGQTLAVSSRSEIQLWDTVTGIHKVTLKGQGSFNRLVFSPDGRTLAAKGEVWRNESGIFLLNIDTTDVQKCGIRYFLPAHRPEVNSVAFSPDGQTLASGYKRENIRLWDVSTGKLKQVFKGHSYPLWVQSVAFFPNGKTLASLSIQSSSSKAEILLWDVATGKYQVTYKGHGKMIGNSLSSHTNSIAFSSDGKTLVSGSLDGTVRLWNIKTTMSDSPIEKLQGVFSGYRKGTLKGHTDQVLSVALSPDGDTIASACLDKTIRLWDMHTQELKAILDKHPAGVESVTFSHDGQTIASCDVNGTIFLWNPITYDRTTILLLSDNPNRTTTSLAFSPDDNYLASAIGRNIFIWDMNTHQLKKTLTEHRGSVYSVKFSPDGTLLASGGSDGTVLIWG